MVAAATAQHSCRLCTQLVQHMLVLGLREHPKSGRQHHHCSLAQPRPTGRSTVCVVAGKDELHQISPCDTIQGALLVPLTELGHHRALRELLGPKLFLVRPNEQLERVYPPLRPRWLPLAS